MSSRFLIDRVASAVGYEVSSHKAWDAKDDEVIYKADWNEFGGEFPAELVELAKSSITAKSLNWYPNISNEELRKAIASFCDCSPDLVDYYHGSDGLHEVIVRCFLSDKKSVLIVGPTYDNFRAVVDTVTDNVNLFNMNISETSCENLLSKIIPVLNKHSPDLIYICNPNNPTGLIWSIESLELLVKDFPDSLWVIDEAYIEFDGTSSIDLCKKYDNIIVCRTLSKAFGLASARFGYCIAHPSIIDALGIVKNHKSITTLAQVLAYRVFQNHKYMIKYTNDVRELKKIQKFKGIDSFATIVGGGNFFLIHLGDRLKEILSTLKLKGIYIRDLSHLESMKGYARVTILSESMMVKLDAILLEVINK